MYYTKEQREDLKTKLQEEITASGLSNNKFAERLGISPGSLSLALNHGQKPGLVGEGTWKTIEKYIKQKRGYKTVATKNLLKVFDTCQRAYDFKCTMVISGEGGYGKTTALKKFKESEEYKGGLKCFYFDASMVSTRKQFVVQFMTLLGCYKQGSINRQISLIRDAVKKMDCLIMIDEVSALEGKKVTVLKDVMTAIHGVCGMVLSGTPYFMQNLNKGAATDKHLFSETKDRLFHLPEVLEPPTEKEAEAIFKANDVDGEALDIVMGKVPEFKNKSYKVQPTYRGIANCITMIKIASKKTNLKLQPLSII